MGLAFQGWFSDEREPTGIMNWVGWAARLFGISVDDAYFLFVSSSGGHVPPKRLAGHIDRYLATRNPAGAHPKCGKAA